MRNAPEVVREVGINDVTMTTKQQLLHLYGGLLGVSPSAVGGDFRRKVGCEDRLPHQHRRCHADRGPNQSLIGMANDVLSRRVPISTVLQADLPAEITDDRPYN